MIPVHDANTEGRAATQALDAEPEHSARDLKIRAIIERLRPILQADGGDIQIVEIIDNMVLVNMTGACVGCQLAAFTLGGVQQRLMEELGEVIRVIPAAQFARHQATRHQAARHRATGHRGA